MSPEFEGIRASQAFLYQKDRLIAALKTEFSSGLLSLEAYESKVEQVESAQTVAQVEALWRDRPAIRNFQSLVITETQTLVCKMATKIIQGSFLMTKILQIEGAMATLELDYRPFLSLPPLLEIQLQLNMTNLTLSLPDTIGVEHAVSENMSTLTEQRSTYYDHIPKQTILKLTGSARMSKIMIQWPAD